MKMLDCFCGMGGVSDGFALEGFDVLGIDIEDAPNKLGYKHRFIQADILTLDGKDFRDYDVIWGSPPCRDFSYIGIMFGHKWKRPPQPEIGLKLVMAFTNFVREAHPTFWIMENVDRMKLFYENKPQIESCLIKGGKKHAFWGKFPYFLMPVEPKHRMFNAKSSSGIPYLKGIKHNSWWRAKIPLACSRAFAKACKEQLDSKSYM